MPNAKEPFTTQYLAKPVSLLETGARYSDGTQVGKTFKCIMLETVRSLLDSIVALLTISKQ